MTTKLTYLLPQTGSDVDLSQQTTKTSRKAASPSKKKRMSTSMASFLPQLSNKQKTEGRDAMGIGKDVVVMLVKEIARSKDETIQAKNQMIELLMSRKCQSCAAGADAPPS